MPQKSRRALVLALTAMLAAAAAAPASADPVVAGPALPDELAVLAIGGVNTTFSQSRADQVALHRLSTADGAYRGRILFPADTLTKHNQQANQPLTNSILRRSADGRFLTFTGVRAAAGQTYQEFSNATAVRVAADGTWTDQRLGAGFLTNTFMYMTGAVTLDGSRTWFSVSSKALATIAPGEETLTQVSAGALATTSVDIVDGSLVVTDGTGVHRLPGALPTAADTTTPLQQFLPVPGANDSTFVDTDGVPGADTAYITRGARGVFKYVLDGGAWKPRGSADGSYGYVAARPVAGAVEVYLTQLNNAKVIKLVDTAQIGGELTTTGATTLAYAPARARYAGLAFAPGTGFPADTTPYPATAPVITAGATSVDTHVGATPKATVTLETFDPNAADVTVTAASANQTILPNDRITIAGTGTTRTVTFDPATAGTTNVVFTARSGDDTATVTVSLRASGPAPDPGAHYYSGPVDLSAAIDVGGDYFLGVSDEVNTIRLFKKGVSGASIAEWNDGFPGGETDFEGATRFGDTLVWSGSHGNNRSGSARPERRFLAFQKITGSGANTELEWSHSYTRLWDQWKTWDATNGHGLGANKLKFNTATVPGLLPNAPFGFNVEGLTMAPGSQTVAWFGMRAPTITGDDGIERAVILPVNNIDKLTSNAVNAEFGAPIFLDLGGRSIRDINKNARDQYLISAGTGDTDDSLKNWALYTWDGNPASQPQMVKELVTDESAIGAWEGIAELPENLVAGSRVLMVADSGDTGLGKSYGQYVTIGEPIPGPAVVTGVAATAKPGAIDATWNAADRATRYYVTVKTAAGAHAPGSPVFVTGTSASFEGLTAGTEYTVAVRAQNVATRSASGETAKVMPTQGARIATTTTFEFVGSKVVGEPQKIVATVSDPNAKGYVTFFASGSTLQDSVLSVPGEGYRRNFPVVDGKAEINIIDSRSPGINDLQAKFTTANAENYLSSDSAIVPTFLEYKPKLPWVELLGIAGDRVAGNRLAITVKLHGYRPAQLWSQSINARFHTRNANATRTPIVGDTTATASGYVDVSADGVATIYTTALAAGTHRIGANITWYSSGYAGMWTDEIPVTIAPAGSPAPEVKPVKRLGVGVTVTGPGLHINGQPVTLTAKVSDPALGGTVRFSNGSDTIHGTVAPVVNGVATYTGVITPAHTQVHARWEPALNRDTTASPVTPAVAILRSITTTPLPWPAAKTTTTALEVEGSRVAGAPLTAKVTVTPGGDDPLGIRDVNGYVEILDGDTLVGLTSTLLGKATIDLSALRVGTHALRARYVPSSEIRSTVSESAAQTVAVRVESNTDAPVGGSVPATLALTLGAPAKFEPFVPGAAKEYTAATTATVISTAGDAALSVSEPGHLTNGAFSLAQPLRVEFSKAAWTGPVSNESVDIAFKQAIGASDPLRTGTYSKTLTFTLSTTTP